MTAPYPTDITSDVELIRDMQYGAVDGRKLWLDLARPKERRDGERLPAIIYMHGGAWQTGDKSDGVPAICFYAHHGFVAVSVGYRLSGEARFPAQIEDCKCAVRFLRAMADEYGIDPERIGAMGASSGAHLAILLGLTGGEDQFGNRGGWQDFSDRVSAVCDLFGPSDFMQWPREHFSDGTSATSQLLGGTIDEMEERYVAASPVNYVRNGAPPFLIVHGEMDEIVPVQQSELLRDALKQAGVEVELHVVKGAGHGSRNVVTPEVRKVILDFFKEQLKK